jgi:hypothetical protein
MGRNTLHRVENGSQKIEAPADKLPGWITEGLAMARKTDKKAIRLTDDQFARLYAGLYLTQTHIRNAGGAAEAANVLAEIGADWELMEAESMYPSDAVHAMPGAAKATHETTRLALADIWELHVQLDSIIGVHSRVARDWVSRQCGEWR